jgi:hypothetical protein
MAKKVKMTALQAAAAELNEVLGVEPAMDVTLDDATLTPFVKKAIKLIDPEADEFTEATQEVIDGLKAAKKVVAPAPAPAAPAKKKAAPAPVVEEDDDDDDEVVEEDDDDDDEEVAVATTTKKKGAAAPAPAEKAKKASPFVAADFTRVDAVCEALKSKPKTKADWVAKADALLVAKGGKANPNETKSQIKKLEGFLKHFDCGFTAPTK